MADSFISIGTYKKTKTSSIIIERRQKHDFLYSPPSPSLMQMSKSSSSSSPIQDQIQSEENQNDEKRKRRRILIVGAGVGGLAVASRIGSELNTPVTTTTKKGTNSWEIVVLEKNPENMVGGR